MADIVGSLFGVTPNQLLQQQADNEFNSSVQFANLSPEQRVAAGGMLAGQMLGRGIANVAGAEDPRLTQARQMQQVKQYAAQNSIDVNTPEGLMQLAQYANSIGATDGAMFLGQQANQLRASASKMKLEEAKAYAEVKKADAEKLTNTARMIQEAGIDVNSPEGQAIMRQALAAEITGKAKGSGSSTSVTIDAGSLAKAMGMDVGKQAAGIEGKYSALDSLEEARKKLKSGIYAGAYGPEQMAAAKYTLGAAGSNKRVQNTEEFMSYIGNTVVPRLQEFGGNDSVEELKYLQRIMGGDQRLEPKSLENILNSAERKIKRGIERVQSQTQAAGTKAPPPLGPGAGREAEQKKPRKVFNPATGKIEVQ